MRKNFIISFCLIFFIAVLLSAGGVAAQTPQFYKLGGANPITSDIFLNSTAAKKIQEWYNPADFNTVPANGTITTIYFRNEIANATGTYVNFIVSLKQPASGIGFTDATYETGLTEALNKPSQILTSSSTAGGWFSITLTTPFAYDNSKPLVFEIKYDSYTGGINTWSSGAGTAPIKKLYSSTTTATTGSSHNAYWQDFGFDVILSPCTTPPLAGTAVSSTLGTVCSNSSVVLGLTGINPGLGQTYQWQSSPAQNGTYSNISSSSTFASYTINPTSTLWYRSKVTCSGQDAFSTPVQVTVNPVFPGGTYNINSSVATGGNNFQTFADAIEAIKCGISGSVILNVIPNTGPYYEQVTIPQIGGTSATTTVTINGNGNTVNYTTINTDSRTAIILNGADHIIIDSLNVDVSQGTFGWGMVLMNQADSNIIRKCTIKGSTSSVASIYSGILINGSATVTSASGNNGNGNLITGNKIIGGYYGIQVYGSTTTYNNNNVISNNVIQEIYYSAIYLFGNSNIKVSGNDISRPARFAVSITYTIYVLNNTGLLIEKNRIHNMFDAAPTNTSTLYGIYVSASGLSATVPNEISNNIFYNFNNGGGAEYPLYGLSYNNYNIFHNTIFLDDQSATAGIAYGICFYGTAVNVKNNIVSISRGGTGAKYCLYYSTTGVTSSNNNVLFMASTTGTTNGIGYYNTGYSTFAAWQAANSAVYDQQSVNVDPMFINAPAGNLIPTSSLVNDKGTSVGVTTDILNVKRNISTPDPGAYEFSVILPVTLLSFKGERQGSINKLNWATLTETNCKGFELQRSADEVDFSTLVFVNTKAAGGNSTSSLTYSFDDTEPLSSNGYYRLKQVDKDGRFVWSNVVLIKGGKINELTLGNIYPNPVHGVLNLIIASPISTEASLVLMGVTGKIITQKSLQVIKGDNQLKLPVKSLASGTYFIKAICANGCNSAVQKFVKE